MVERRHFGKEKASGTKKAYGRDKACSGEKATTKNQIPGGIVKEKNYRTGRYITTYTICLVPVMIKLYILIKV